MRSTVVDCFRERIPAIINGGGRNLIPDSRDAHFQSTLSLTEQADYLYAACGDCRASEVLRNCRTTNLMTCDIQVYDRLCPPRYSQNRFMVIGWDRSRTLQVC